MKINILQHDDKLYLSEGDTLDDYPAARIYPTMIDDDDANEAWKKARLLAAAPGLLSAAQYVESCTDGIEPPAADGSDDEEIITLQMTVKGWRDLRSAIAKAEGENPK